MANLWQSQIAHVTGWETAKIAWKRENKVFGWDEAESRIIQRDHR